MKVTLTLAWKESAKHIFLILKRPEKNGERVYSLCQAEIDPDAKEDGKWEHGVLYYTNPEKHQVAWDNELKWSKVTANELLIAIEQLRTEVAETLKNLK
jgi:hypothetical protein